MRIGMIGLGKMGGNMAQHLTIEALPGIVDPWAVEGICARVRQA